MSGTAPFAHAGRRATLLAVGALLAGALAGVGRPGGAAGGQAGHDPTALDRGELSTWCQRSLGDAARADLVGPRWWCAGRPGGVWRMELLDQAAACRSAGQAGGRQAATDTAVRCRVGERP